MLMMSLGAVACKYKYLYTSMSQQHIVNTGQDIFGVIKNTYLDCHSSHQLWTGNTTLRNTLDMYIFLTRVEQIKIYVSAPTKSNKMVL